MRKRGKITTRPEGWAQIDPRCKPSKAAGATHFRPTLRHGLISHEKDGSYLCMTDSFVLVRLPITLDGKTVKDRKAFLPGRAILFEALKALDRSRTGYFRIKNDCLEVYGEPMLYPLPSDIGAFPDTRKLLPPESDKDDGLTKIGINPALIRKVAEAMGGNGSGITMHFISPVRPVRITALGIEGEGLVMPIRLNS